MNSGSGDMALIGKSSKGSQAPGEGSGMHMIEESPLDMMMEEEEPNKTHTTSLEPQDYNFDSILSQNEEKEKMKREIRFLCQKEDG